MIFVLEVEGEKVRKIKKFFPWVLSGLLYVYEMK